MELLFSTEKEAPSNRLRRWKEIVSELIFPEDQIVPKDVQFSGKIEVKDISNINFIKLSNSAAKRISTAKVTHSDINVDRLFISIQLSGKSFCEQDGRFATRAPGEFILIDRGSSVIEAENGNQCLVMVMPRDRIEKTLGSTRRYTALTIGRDLASTGLATNFFKDLLDVSERLSLDAAARLAAIGIDLIVASIAERLAQDVPRSLHGTIIVQRAKAYVEAHFDDPNLDPPQLATAVGVSLRRLQQLFHEHGRSISDWIWQRRLEVAALRLADPGYAHLSIGELAYGCGFTDQAHFTRRFKNHHGITPREYRWRGLINPR